MTVSQLWKLNSSLAFNDKSTPFLALVLLLDPSTRIYDIVFQDMTIFEAVCVFCEELAEFISVYCLNKLRK
jgi:hypothetical protein